MCFAVEFWPWVYKLQKYMYAHFFLLIELLLCIPFSTAVVERCFPAIRQIVTDWRSTLREKLIVVALHFSTRKGPLKEKRYRDRLVNDAADTFLKELILSMEAQVKLLQN